MNDPDTAEFDPIPRMGDPMNTSDPDTPRMSDMDAEGSVRETTSSPTGPKAVIGAAQQEAASAAEGAKNAIASHVVHVASALHRTSEQLEEEDEKLLSDYAERLSQRVHRVADHLERGDVGQLSDELSDLARARPLAFIGGAALLGFAAARLLKSSPPESYGASSPREQASAEHFGGRL